MSEGHAHIIKLSEGRKGSAREGRTGQTEKSEARREGHRQRFIGNQKGVSGSHKRIPHGQGHHEPKDNPRNMVERAVPHTGPKPLMPWNGEEQQSQGTQNSPGTRSGNQAGQRATVTWRGGPGATPGPESHSGHQGREGRTEGGGGRDQRANQSRM